MTFALNEHCASHLSYARRAAEGEAEGHGTEKARGEEPNSWMELLEPSISLDRAENT